MVLFDNNVLCLLLLPEANVPNDPATKAPIVRAADRIKYLVERLQQQGVIIVIPTPVIGEFLTYGAPDYLVEINQSIWFEVVPFDQRAAIESAVALRRALAPGGPGKTLGLPETSWQKIKVDRQIIAIGKAKGVTEVFSTDKDVIALARESKLVATHVADLPLPPLDEKPQMSFEDLLATTPSASSSENAPPSGQSPSVEPETAPSPELVRPEAPQAAPGPPPPGSSPGDPLKPPSVE